MARPKRTLKMRRRNTRKNRKMNKRGGVGMLTPPGSPIQQQGSPNFIDVDTPGSMHLSELDVNLNPDSGFTDEESGASGFQGLNLTHQFDDAASTEDNSLSSSMDNAVPGQEGEDAASFGSLGHGGKRKRKMKGGRKTRKYKKRSMKGGVRTWEQLPQEVEHSVYDGLPQGEREHYSTQCFHKKNSNASIGEQSITARQSANRARIEAAAKRMQEIASDPNAKIVQDEYNSLPQQEKQNWVAIGAEWGQPTIYRRKQQKDDVNWRARNTANIHLDEREYAALNAETKALRWVKVVDSNWRDSTVYYRRRVAADDELDQVKEKIKTITTESEQILAAVRPVRTGRVLDEASIPRFSIITDRDAYVTLPQDRYNRYMVLSHLLEDEEAKKNSLERQLRKL